MLSQLLHLAYGLIRPGVIISYALGYYFGVKEGREENLH